MAVIGTFTPAKDGGWIGTIRTLTIDAKVRLVPNDDRTSKKAPAFRVLVGNSRVGEAWEAKTRGLTPKDYLKVRIDDPVLTKPISAAMFVSEGGIAAQLLWALERIRSTRPNSFRIAEVYMIGSEVYGRSKPTVLSSAASLRLAVEVLSCTPLDGPLPLGYLFG